MENTSSINRGNLLFVLEHRAAVYSRAKFMAALLRESIRCRNSSLYFLILGVGIEIMQKFI